MNHTPALLDLASLELPATTRGALRGFRHSKPSGRLYELAHHKRWYYLSAATDSLLVGASIVSLAYLGKAFFYVADKTSGRMLAHETALLPAGTFWKVAREEQRQSVSVFRSPRVAVRMVRTTLGAYSVRCKSPSASIELMLDPENEPFVASNLLAGAGTNITEKNLAMRGRGNVRIKGKTYSLDNAMGASDFTDGYLPRRTIWKWASTSGRAQGHNVGLNLVQGFMGSCECVLCIDGVMLRLGEAIIDKPADPMQAWQVRTTCGRIDLHFRPFALHQETTNLRIIHARFLQPIGSFSGTVHGNDGKTITLQEQLGVCEDQDVLW